MSNKPGRRPFAGGQKVAELRARGMRWSAIAAELGINVRTAMRSVPNQKQAAINLAVRYGGIGGDHHKAWVIDQMVRVLSGKDYERIVRQAKSGEDGPDTYRWDVGIAP